MKPGLAVLPLEVWTDVFVFPWITRRKLAQIVDKIGDRKFAEKLQFRLHDMGKHSLHYLDIQPNNSYQFPECEMPENIKKFKRLTIRHLDDNILDFLDRIEPLFTNVFLNIGPIKPAQAIPHCVFFGNMLQLVRSIRGIFCDNNCVELLERHFPGALARSKELDLIDATLAGIPAYLNWLNAPQDFDVDGPRFLVVYGESMIASAIVDAVRQQFLAATASFTFVIFIQFRWFSGNNRQDEFQLENAVTNEQLTVRNAVFDRKEWPRTHYLEILRHPTGAEAKMRQWMNGRAYYEKKYNDQMEEEQQIIMDPGLTIGQITKEADALDQDGPPAKKICNCAIS